MSRTLVILLFTLLSCANFRTLKYKDSPNQIIASKEKATVCILRPPNQIGGNYIIHDQEEKIGVLSGSSYFVIQLAPGKHVFSYSDAWKKSKDKFEINLEKEKTYYIALNQVKVGSYASPQMVDSPVYAGKFLLVKEEAVKHFFSEMNEVDLEASKSIYQ